MKGGLYIEKKQEENRREEITSKSLKLGFPGGTSVKEPACQYRRHKRQITYLYGEGNGTPLQYSCLENPMDRGAW